MNLWGTHCERGLTLLPGDGDGDGDGGRELEMMRIFEASGGRGPIGIVAEYVGDAREVNIDQTRHDAIADRVLWVKGIKEERRRLACAM